jgi:hypothetical protein
LDKCLMVRNAFAMSASTLALVLMLAGCAPTASTQIRSPEATPTGDASPSTISPSAEEASSVDGDPCAVLGAGAVETLAGAELEPHRTQVGTAPACLWGDLDATGVQVARMGAGAWADQMPILVGQLEESGTLPAEQMAALEEAAAMVEAGDTIEPARACDLFSVMLEMTGRAPGTEFSLTVFPTVEDPQAISGQACVDGVYSSVMLVRSNLAASPKEQAGVNAALQEVVRGS